MGCEGFHRSGLKRRRLQVTQLTGLASCENGRFKICVRLRHRSRLSLFGELRSLSGAHTARRSRLVAGPVVGEGIHQLHRRQAFFESIRKDDGCKQCSA